MPDIKMKILRSVCVFLAIFLPAGLMSDLNRSNGFHPDAGVSAAGAGTALDSGLSLFGPYGEGHSYFIPNSMQVKTGEIHTVGWADIETQEGVYNWSSIDNYLNFYTSSGKKAAIRIQSAGHSTREMPRWVYDDYGVRQITGQGIFFDFTVAEAATQKSLKKLRSGGDEYTSSIAGGTKQNGVLQGAAGTTLIESAGHISEFSTQLGFDYSGSGSIVVTVEKDGAEKTVRTFTASAPWESAMFLIPRSELSYDSILRIKVISGSISLDNVSISAQTGGVHNNDRNLTYPNYFDPMYTEKYSNFIHAFAVRYKDNPSVGAVVVGGFGRWDELSMLGDDTNEYNLMTRQWRAYGYTDDLFIDHIEKMCKLFTKEFGQSKDIILHIAAFSLPITGLGERAGDSNYVGYAVNNLAKKYGFAAKINGLTEKYTEWDQAAYGFNYFANRYKYADGAKHILEEAIQINNPWAYWMGHPQSLFNRIMIDQVDNYWFYGTDLKLPFVMKYAHAANEQAGNAVFTRFYNILKTTPFKADQTWWAGSGEANTDRVLRNLWNGIYLPNAVKRTGQPSTDARNDEHKDSYTSFDGREVLTTSPQTGLIRFSLDDRQSYNVLYGSVLSVTYYDSGLDDFSIKVTNEKETRTLATVVKTNSQRFKTVLLYVGDFFDTKNNGDKEGVPHEITIDSNGSGTDYVSDIELLSVTSLDWAESSVHKPVMPATPAREVFGKGDSVRVIEIPYTKPLSSVDLPVGTGATGYVKLEASVYSVTGSEKNLLTVKEYYMPGEEDAWRIPVADAGYRTDKIRIELKCLIGNAYILKDTAGKYAYTSRSFLPKAGPVLSARNSTTSFDALLPFYGFTLSASSPAKITLQKRLASSWISIMATTDSGSGKLITFEPQSPGQYRLIHSGDSKADFAIHYLGRRSAPNKPTRNNLGTEINSAFLQASKETQTFWKPVTGFRNNQYQAGIWSAEITAANPAIETSAAFAVTPDKSQIFHIIIKNETASDMIKLYWKNAGDSGYSEAKSAYITVVANDTEFREYSYPIGQEASRYSFAASGGYNVLDLSSFTYADAGRGAVTGFKVVPVVGQTVTAGRISIVTMDLRQNNTVDFTFNEPLAVQKIISGETLVPVKYDAQLPQDENSTASDVQSPSTVLSGAVPSGEESQTSSSGHGSDAGSSVGSSSGGDSISQSSGLPLSGQESDGTNAVDSTGSNLAGSDPQAEDNTPKGISAAWLVLLIAAAFVLTTGLSYFIAIKHKR
ncbi:MAG: hypothetical protein ACYC5K_01685 [Saccharofermentanales bacterium]